jgi:L-amino acid N-acyltransferase YncA
MVGKLEVPRRKFPWTDKINGREITFKLMKKADRDNLLRFSQALPHDDLIFLRTDISKPEVVDEWIARIEAGRTMTVLAVDDDEDIIGYASLHHNELLWTRHLAEIRLFVQRELRGTGLGKRLLNEMLQIAGEQRLSRLIVNIPRDQPHVRQMLERLGFQVEALLTDWLMDRDGRTHDLLIMSHHIEEY